MGRYPLRVPQAGDFQFDLFARVPQPKKGSAAGKVVQPVAELAAAHGLEEDLGVIDSEVFLGFVWQVVGRPPEAPPNWRRERPLVIVVDNYQVHRSQRVRLARRTST